jgi:hypothetical protein
MQRNVLNQKPLRPLKTEAPFFGQNSLNGFCNLKHESNPLSVHKKHQRLYVKSKRFEWYHTLNPPLFFPYNTFTQDLNWHSE